MIGKVSRDKGVRATFQINERWRLSEDGELQWILQREEPKAKSERHRWMSVAFCGTREGLSVVALPHHKVNPTDAACRALERLPKTYEPGALERVAAEMLDRAA